MRSSPIAFLAATNLAMCAPAMAQDHSSIQTVLQARTGVWTYPGTGTVNTYWIETPGGGLVVIDVQRDLVHAAQALAAVKAVGKPVRAIFVTHAHPDHYTGLGVFRQAFPGVPVYSSKATADAIRNDTYGANAGEQADARNNTPRDFVAPGSTFDNDTTLQIDGLTIITRELGAGEAPATAAYYLPSTRELFSGDAILNRLHGPLRGAHTGQWLGIIERLDAMYPNVTIVHPGHGASGSKQPPVTQGYRAQGLGPAALNSRAAPIHGDSIRAELARLAAAGTWRAERSADASKAFRH